MGVCNCTARQLAERAADKALTRTQQHTQSTYLATSELRLHTAGPTGRQVCGCQESAPGATHAHRQAQAATQQAGRTPQPRATQDTTDSTMSTYQHRDTRPPQSNFQHTRSHTVSCSACCQDTTKQALLPSTNDAHTHTHMRCRAGTPSTPQSRTRAQQSSCGCNPPPKLITISDDQKQPAMFPPVPALSGQSQTPQLSRLQGSELQGPQSRSAGQSQTLNAWSNGPNCCWPTSTVCTHAHICCP